MMPNCTEKESNSQNEFPEDDSFMRNLGRLRLELTNINREKDLHSQRENENWGAAKYGIGYEVDRTEADYPNSEDYSVYNNTDEDDDVQSLFRCPSCDFELEMPVLRTRLEEVQCYDPKNMVCPVCDEYLGEVAPHSSSRKRTWKPRKSTMWYSNYATLEEKLAAWTKKQEPVPIPNPSDIHPDEDSFSDTSDISVEKSYETDALDTGDEEDHEERRQRASFVQELVLSTLF